MGLPVRMGFNSLHFRQLGGLVEERDLDQPLGPHFRGWTTFTGADFGEIRLLKIEAVGREPSEAVNF